MNWRNWKYWTRHYIRAIRVAEFPRVREVIFWILVFTAGSILAEILLRYI